MRKTKSIQEKNEREALKMNLKNLKKKIQGITLIALVVTVIVLLILAGVAINLTVGDNGLFKRAQNAADTWQMAELNEQKKMEQARDFLDDYSNNITRVDGVPIPNGFYYVGGEKNTGLIISDDSADKNKYSKDNWSDQSNIPSGAEKEIGLSGEIEQISGNQFVWIPVINFKRCLSYVDGKLNNEYFNACEEPYKDAAKWEIDEYSSMLESVTRYSGFYIARFEASEEENKIISKPGIKPLGYTSWGDSNTEIGNDGAVYKAQNMYQDFETYGVTSTLPYGIEWDAIMSFIDPNYLNEDGTCQSFVSDSTGKGNNGDDENTNEWKGYVVECGISDDYRIKNIYDLNGNVQEWTMEVHRRNTDEGDYIGRVYRGGSIYYKGKSFPASYRNDVEPKYYNVVTMGFRVALYI